MSQTIKAPPKTVWLGNMEYPMNTDFRVSIDFETLILKASGMSEEEQILKTLELYYDGYPAQVSLALEAALAFYSGDDGFTVGKIKEESGTLQRPIYNYEHDFKYIYASFLEQYRIDLYTIEYLHWWSFKAMFESLRDETQMKKIMSYRSAKVEKGMSTEQKNDIKRMHRIWDLPLNKTDQDFEDELTAVLMGDGNLDAFIAKKQSLEK